MRMCVCSLLIDSQTAEWIFTKLCRHDPRVPTKVFFFLAKKKKKKKNPENITPGRGKRN